jgi:RimJ/RimL family protein N-acetyltransferase
MPLPFASDERAPTLDTPRLRLRAWREDDLPEFARMNADPRVMEFMPRPLDRAGSDALVARVHAHFAARGFGWWAVEMKAGPPFIGCVGLLVPGFTAPFTPCVEIGWRLAAEQWGHGHATEAAHAVLEYGFTVLQLDEIVSFTTMANARSRRVMEKIGLRHDPAGDFDHPKLPEGHPLRRHVLCRLRREVWRR